MGPLSLLADFIEVFLYLRLCKWLRVPEIAVFGIFGHTYPVGYRAGRGGANRLRIRTRL